MTLLEDSVPAAEHEALKVQMADVTRQLTEQLTAAAAEHRHVVSELQAMVSELRAGGACVPGLVDDIGQLQDNFLSARVAAEAREAELSDALQCLEAAIGAQREIQREALEALANERDRELEGSRAECATVFAELAALRTQLQHPAPEKEDSATQSQAVETQDDSAQVGSVRG